MLINVAEKDEIGIGGDGNCKNEIDKKLPSKNLAKAMNYLTSDARQTFTQLKQAFTKAPILQHFDPKYYIWIKIDTSKYVIRSILSQLIEFG